MPSLTGKPAPKNYWSYALEYCIILEPDEVIPSRFRCINHYWRSIGAILNNDGKPKYVQLYQPDKSVLSVSHALSLMRMQFQNLALVSTRNC